MLFLITVPCLKQNIFKKEIIISKKKKIKENYKLKKIEIIKNKK